MSFIFALIMKHKDSLKRVISNYETNDVWFEMYLA